MQPNGEARPLSATTQRPGLARRLSLRNWRVPQRLIALVLIPTIFAVTLGGLRIAASAGNADSYARVEQLAGLGSAVTVFTHEFAAERDQSAAYVAAGRDPSQKAGLLNQYAKVDAAAGQVRALAARIDSSYGSAAVAAITIVVDRLDGITPLRNISTGSAVPAITVIEKYSASIDEILGFLDGITQGGSDAALAQDGRALATLARAKEQASLQRGLLLAGMIVKRLDPDELSALRDARAREDSELLSFRIAATLSQRQRYDDTVIGPDVDRASEIRQQAFTSAAVSGRLPTQITSGTGAAVWQATMTATIDKMRVVEQGIAGDILAQTRSRQSAAQRSAFIDGGAAAALLVLVLVATLVIAGSLVRPLRRLRNSALDVAGNRLPGLVERLRDPAAISGGIEIEPVDVDTTDEIGEVARAFDEVHREAVRLAANEAVLRGNINAMFVNLSRRSQSLIERQLRIIDDLEQGERDDERLASLFRLDHLATRMRRNCENLLVLGGQDQVRKWNQPVPLLDVIRASLSEVEQYERVSLRIQGEVSVVGPVVNDLIHLIAELVENAITFSPEHTKVEITGHLLSGGGAMLQITDGGVGMSEEELDEANWRLGHQPEIDVSVARRMGLFVVGRLAGRHGIRVELRASPTGGLTAFGLLPAQLIALAEVPLVPLRRLDPPVESWRSQVQPEPQLRPPPQLQPQLRPVRSVFQPVSKPDPWAERPALQPAQVATAGAQWTNRRVERSPIFEAMESEWFQHRDLPGDPGAWHSPADAGWQAAADVVQAPTAKGRTAAGLPQRVPGQNRLAGAVPQQTAGRQPTAHPPVPPVPVAPAPPPPTPAVAEAVRNRFSGLQQGVNRGRAEARAQYSETGDTQ